MALEGVVNGTKVILEIEQTLDQADYIAIPGEQDHGLTFAVAGIEANSKDFPDVRCYIEGEGMRTLEATLNTLSNDEPAYKILFTNLVNRTFVRIRQIVGDVTIISQYMVLSSATTAGQSEAVTNAFTLSSHGVADITIAP